MTKHEERLAEIRQSIVAENVSYGELVELASLAGHIDLGDVLLLEAAGVPEDLGGETDRAATYGGGELCTCGCGATSAPADRCECGREVGHS